MNESQALPEGLHEGPTLGRVPFPPPQLSEGFAELYREFWRLWAQERFHACHEVLEVLWRQTEGVERLFYNGLIHCAVAEYQHRRGNHVGAARQLLRARVKLRRFMPRHGGVALDELLAAMEKSIAPSLEALSESDRRRLDELRRALEIRVEEQFPTEHATEPA